MNETKIKRHKLQQHHWSRHQRRSLRLNRSQCMRRKGKRGRSRGSSSSRKRGQRSAIQWLFAFRQLPWCTLKVPFQYRTFGLRVVLAQTTRNRQRLAEYTFIPIITGNASSLAYSFSMYREEFSVNVIFLLIWQKHIATRKRKKKKLTGNSYMLQLEPAWVGLPPWRT